MHDRGREKQHQENKKEHLRNASRGGGDAAKTKNGGDDRNYQEYKSIAKHNRPLE